MAFDSEDEDERPVGEAAGKSDPSELGRLAAELPASDWRANSPPGHDSDDAIDSSVLAALSRRQSAPQVDTAGEDQDKNKEKARVKLEGEGAIGGAAESRSSVRGVSSATRPGASSGWFIALVIGFVVGVPVGGALFSHTTTVSVPASPAKPSNADREAQLAAAEERARAADEVAAAVRPLPAQRTAEPAAEPSQPTAAEASAAARPSGPENTQLATSPAPPTAASAIGPGKKLVGPGPGPGPAPGSDPRAREAAHAATAALYAQLANGTAAQPALPQPTAAQVPHAAVQPPAQPPPPAQASVQPSPAAQPGAQPAPRGPDGRSVDELLDQALASSTARKEQERADHALAPPDVLPLNPSREDVTRAMTVILPAIRGCAAGRSGLATVGLVVKNDGRVESATVSGAPFEGDRSGRCMEGVVRRAKFPRFQQSTFRIQFPFAIQ